MKKGQPAGRQGFTLLEILISVGIIAVVATLLAQVLFTTTHVNTKTEVLTDIKEDGNFVLGVLERMIRSAAAVETSCAQSETTAAAASITNPDEKVTTIRCYSDGSAARVASESASGGVVYLSEGDVTLSSSGGADCTDSTLVFSCPPATGGVQNQLTITFTLRRPGVSAGALENGSAAFQSTVRMRK